MSIELGSYFQVGMTKERLRSYIQVIVPCPFVVVFPHFGRSDACPVGYTRTFSHCDREDEVLILNHLVFVEFLVDFANM